MYALYLCCPSAVLQACSTVNLDADVVEATRLTTGCKQASHLTSLCFGLQRDAIGPTVKLDDDGFPDISSLHLGVDDQEALRYEGLQAAARERQQRQAEQQQQQQQQASSSTARTPFADARPQQDDRYYLLLHVAPMAQEQSRFLLRRSCFLSCRCLLMVW